MEEGILLEDKRGNITFVNRKTAELLGYTAEELSGKHVMTIVAPEAKEVVEQEMAKRPHGAAGHYETILLAKDGMEFKV